MDIKYQLIEQDPDSSYNIIGLFENKQLAEAIATFLTLREKDNPYTPEYIVEDYKPDEETIIIE
jgi:hypothetical protein